MWLRICVLMLLAAGGAALVRSAAAAGMPTSSVGPTLPFAIADFDGDQRPDVARVEQGGGNSSATRDYWVGLKLSASGGRYIRLAAPQGGLRVEARDVNGDHAVDLVFASAWLARPVAILLNDGHGNFSQVDPETFPAAFAKSSSGLRSPAGHSLDIPGLAQEPPSGSFCLARTAAAVQPETRSLCGANSDAPLALFLLLRAGRSPPLQSFL